MAAVPWVVSDALWELVEPLLPRKERRFRYPGRKRLPDREALQGILFVLHTGIAWRHPAARARLRLRGDLLAAPRGVAARRCLGAAARAAARPTARRRGDRLVASCGVDSSHVQVKKGAPKRARALWTEAGEAPSTISASRRAGSRSPSRSTVATATTSPSCSRSSTRSLPCAAGSGGRAGEPERVTADRGYDHDTYSRQLRQRGIRPEIARRSTEHGSGLGRFRWVVERTFAWLHHFKRLLVRYDRRAEIHRAFLALGCCLVCFRRLQRSF
jgi:transposase